MPSKHTLGMIKVRAGEILTFTYDSTVPEERRNITVVALDDIDLSEAMATFCELTDRSGKDIYTENALPAFVEYLAEQRLLHVGTEVNVHFGQMRRPAARLLNEYRFKANPESFWEDKLVQHYLSKSFTVFNHQHHVLTMMAGVEAPFYISGSIIDMKGDILGVLRLSVLSDSRHTLISNEDIERIRLAFQADIALNVREINVMVERVELTSNPDFGANSFKRHLPPLVHPHSSKPAISTQKEGNFDESNESAEEASV